MSWRWTALAAGVVAVAVVIVAASSGAEAETRAWHELPAPPLSPRELPTGFWAGEEVVLVGGSDAPPCPPSASCRSPETPPLADGTAYDPRTNTWRRIADAPIGFTWTDPIVLGSTAYLWIPGEPRRPDAPSAFLVYHVDQDRWEELELPTQEPGWYRLVGTGDRVVAFSGEDSDGGRPDLVFDPLSSSWSELPDDPFSPGFDRVMIWDGNELLLFDHELVQSPGGDLPLRGAALDVETGEWRIFDDPDAAFARSGWMPEDPLAGILDESGARYFRRDGEVRDEVEDKTLRMPELEPVVDAQGGTTDVTAGTDLFVFMGSSWSHARGELHSEAWLWSPRS
jgi:hypothetical protein